MGLFDRFFGGNNDKKTNRQTQKEKNQAAFDDRMQSPMERKALDKQVIDAIKAKRGIRSLTTDDINRDYGRAKANLEKVLVDYGRGAKTSMGGRQFGDGTRDFTPSDFDSQGNLRFFSANSPTFGQMLGDVGRSGFIPAALAVMGGPLSAGAYAANKAIGNAGGLGSLFSTLGESLGLSQLQNKLLNIKTSEQMSDQDSLQEIVNPPSGVYQGESLPPQGQVTVEDMSPLEEFSNFNQVPPGYQFQERDTTGMGSAENPRTDATDPTGMGGAEGTLYDPTTIGGMRLFPETDPTGMGNVNDRVSQTDYSGQRTRPFSTQTSQNIFEENNPGDLNVYSQTMDNARNDQRGFNQLVYPELYQDSLLRGFAYGGDINRATMNSQSLSASDNIDDRIMKNLQFEQKAPGMMGYNQGGQAMSTYEKLKMINDSVAQG